MNADESGLRAKTGIVGQLPDRVGVMNPRGGALKRCKFCRGIWWVFYSKARQYRLRFRCGVAEILLEREKIRCVRTDVGGAMTFQGLSSIACGQG